MSKPEWMAPSPFEESDKGCLESYREGWRKGQVALLKGLIEPKQGCQLDYHWWDLSILLKQLEINHE